MGQILAIATLIATMVLLVVFHTTTPSSVGPLGILFVFILMYVLTLGMLTFLIYTIGNFLRRGINVVAAKRPLREVTLIRSYYFASVVALAPVMLVGIHSVGKVGFYDVLLVGVFVIISCVYVSKRTQ